MFEIMSAKRRRQFRPHSSERVNSGRIVVKNLIAAVALVALGTGSAAGADVTYIPAIGAKAGGLTKSEQASARVVLPMLKSAAEVPKALRLPAWKKPVGKSEFVPGSSGSVVAAPPVRYPDTSAGGSSVADSRAYGTQNHPFTTRGVWAAGTSAPTTYYPFRATGKLWMNRNGSWSVCTASLIRKGLLVTAAHCIWRYGVANSAPTQVVWQPARFAGSVPYGQYNHSGIWLPTVYINGTDECTTTGVVCANDVAVITLNKGSDGKFPGEKTGWYGYGTNGYSYASYFGARQALITQLGYPAAFESGYKMIRTDSMGYEANPNNVIIGSNQTGGSSGGPWLVNFGMEPAKTHTNPTANAMAVVATTSWGYVSAALKQQGASRFGNNSKFPTTTNITALINAACTAKPANC
jgi:V8-like Glu-specific endopeptidase